jgi:thermostable 8-oxoguanine DNA glycosylase
VILNLQQDVSPFDVIKFLDKSDILMYGIMKAKLGQYNKLYKAFKYLCDNNLNLSACSAQDLEKIPGIGMKTSRFFIMHSRDSRDIAVLDVHILKFLSSLGYNVPKTTPNKKQYLILEKIFLNYCTENNIHPAQADLNIWKSYAKKQNKVAENV